MTPPAAAPAARPVVPGEPGDVVLELRNVRRSFRARRGRRVEALGDVSLRVRRGRITGLVGPDAAGKTTLMRLAAGLMRPDSGSVTVLGADPAARAPADLAYMPQRFGLYEDLTVQQNLDLYADLQGAPRQERPARYALLAGMTGLGPFSRRLAGKLSGGMKQKLGLACTLVRSPKLLLLDEPTAGVDPVSRRELWQIIRCLVGEEGVTVLLSTAYLDEAERCDDVAILHDGELLGDGTPESFAKRGLGRTFAITAPGLARRRAQAMLRSAPGVADSVIEIDAVRVVMERPGPPDLAALLPEAAGARAEAVPPTLEDGFVLVLRARRTRDPAAGEAPAEAAPAPGPAGESVIEVRDVKRRFGDFYAVNGITFDVARGEVFGLLGANGAGKTTTFRMLCGLLPLTAGSLRVAGVDLRRAAAAARARIGYMSQRFSLYGDLDVLENLRFFASAYGLTGKRRAARIEHVLDDFALDPFAGTTSAELPLGFKQRLAMACALVHEPEILFLDEPTSGVDPLARREFWARINGLAEAGVTILVTTHFMQEAEYCDRLAIMEAGRMLAVGSPGEIRDLARRPDRPEPSMEDAFVSLLESAAGRSAAS